MHKRTPAALQYKNAPGPNRLAIHRAAAPHAAAGRIIISIGECDGVSLSCISNIAKPANSIRFLAFSSVSLRSLGIIRYVE
jgi:hypothetical protein